MHFGLVWLTRSYAFLAASHSFAPLHPASFRPSGILFPREPGWLDARMVHGSTCLSPKTLIHAPHPNKNPSRTGPTTKPTKHDHLHELSLTALGLYRLTILARMVHHNQSHPTSMDHHYFSIFHPVYQGMIKTILIMPTRSVDDPLPIDLRQRAAALLHPHASSSSSVLTSTIKDIPLQDPEVKSLLQKRWIAYRDVRVRSLLSSESRCYSFLFRVWHLLQKITEIFLYVVINVLYCAF